MKNSIKVLIAGVSLVVLSGCTSVGSQPTGNEEATYYTSSGVSQDYELFENISVETHEFLETTKNAFSAKSTANLNNENAKKVIEASLNEANLLARGEGRYLLTARLVDADLAGVFIGTNRNEKRSITIEYNLVDLFNQSSLYDNVITGRAERDAPFVANAWTQQKITSEIAYKDNFRQLIEDLKDL